MPTSGNDSSISIMLRPTGKSLSPNADNNINLIYPNRSITTTPSTTTISVTDTKPSSRSSISTTLTLRSTTTSTTARSTFVESVVDDRDSVKENDIFVQQRINVAEVDKVDTIAKNNVTPGNDTRNIIAMGYTNNSFEDERFPDHVNDTFAANMTDAESLNISHSSSVANSNLIDDSGGNVSPGEGQLSAAGITGITVGCVSVVGLLSAVSFVLYRYRTFNRPEALNDYCSNLDSSGYIDDTSIRDNSEEMYSLDNDSFLNSLEAMTIQNYWTDKVKHTKL